MRAYTALSLLFLAAPLLAQSSDSARVAPTRRAMSDTSSLARPPRVYASGKRCLRGGILNDEANCQGRVATAATYGLVGAGLGGMIGLAGGALFRTRCIGDYERTAVRGAIAGAAVGTTYAALGSYQSGERQWEDARRARERALANPVRPWSWEDVRPLASFVGGSALVGAGIGAVEGARHPDDCAGGAASGAARGAGVYAGGLAAGVTGALLVVRFLF